MRYFKSVLALLSVLLLLAACKKECEHEYQSEITKAASCTGEGVETFTCVHCEDKYEMPVPILEHTYEFEEVSLEPTCEKTGKEKYTCSGCGEAKYENIEKLPHTLGEPFVAKEPNCLEEGCWEAQCSVCGANQEVEKIPTNEEHNMVDHVLRNATCTEVGEGEKVCMRCGYSEPCQYPLREHDYTNVTVTVSPTCTDGGHQKATCEMCGKVEEKALSALGHKWSGANCQQKGKCENCGETGKLGTHDYEIILDMEPVTVYAGYFAGERKYSCKVCQYSYTYYYGKTGEYNMEKIRTEAEKYAKQKGFHIGSWKISNASYSFKVMMQDLEKNGGQKHMIEQLKKYIDRAYDNIKSNPGGVDNYALCISVGYSKNANLGCGWIGASVDVKAADLV